MTQPIGTVLQQLRTARGLSQRGLATQARMSPSTVSRWESSTFQPSLSELEAAMGALNASAAQRAQVLSLLDAPRALVRAQQEAQTHATERVKEIGDLPSVGDLLRAMRHRSRLTVEEVAHAMKVHSRTVRYWEQGRSLPSVEVRLALCHLLNAYPEETASLTARRRALALPLPDPPASLDEIEHRLDALIDEVCHGGYALIDLRFLTIEAQLWHLAVSGHARARSMLHRANVWRARGLKWRGRWKEVAGSVDRVLNRTPRDAPRESYLMRAVLLHAEAAGFDLPGPDVPARSVEALRPWLTEDLNLEWTYWLSSGVGDWISLDGEFDTALKFARQACEAAERAENLEWLWKGRKLQADILLRAGRPHDALSVLPTEIQIYFVDGYFSLLSWAEVLLALGEKTAAETYVQRAFETAPAYALDDTQARSLAQRL